MHLHSAWKHLSRDMQSVYDHIVNKPTRGKNLKKVILNLEGATLLITSDRPRPTSGSLNGVARLCGVNKPKRGQELCVAVCGWGQTKVSGIVPEDLVVFGRAPIGRAGSGHGLGANLGAAGTGLRAGAVTTQYRTYYIPLESSVQADSNGLSSAAFKLNLMDKNSLNNLPFPSGIVQQQLLDSELVIH
ncbi:hypothetical protein OH77DRAFT_1440543 [Trametes cingulata]|nr:hypothetical protein OH77DRAFT_1440543 [Trametes cingulata]